MLAICVIILKEVRKEGGKEGGWEKVYPSTLDKQDLGWEAMRCSESVGLLFLLD